MKSPKRRIKFYLLFYGSFLLVQFTLVKYFNFEIGQVFPVIAVLSIFISFINLLIELLELVKFIKDNYLKELEKVLPKTYKIYLYTSRWGMWFAFSSYDFGSEVVKEWKEYFRIIFGLHLLYTFIVLPISFFGPQLVEWWVILN